MSEKVPTTESEEEESLAPLNPHKSFFQVLSKTPSGRYDVPIRKIFVGFTAIWVYYLIADEFVRQMLLNLTP
ncbi:uncharacterized protein METZ01_LOCUS510603, partial [marine metagenome]